MDKIIFIVNSNNIHLYFWKCIERIHKEFEGVHITIFINENSENHNNYAFNSLIDYIDSKYSNLKTNPLTLINLKQETHSYSNIQIVKNVDELELSDWVILENKQENTDRYINYAKNGMLQLALNRSNLVHAVLKKSLINLSIIYKDFKANNWQEIFNVSLKNEIGLKNNVHKILHNYSIYLTKFLRNNTNEKFSKNPHPEVINSTDKISFSLKLKVAFYYIKLLFKIITRKIKKEEFNWKIGIKKGNELSFLNQPKNSFWADPFFIKENNGNLFVYFEELKTDKLGKIACVELNAKLEIIRKEDIINTNYHLSFPNVFKREGSYYMIPESSQNGSLQLYKCTQFPFKWEFQMNLMKNIKLLDAVWIYHNDFYWIFSNKIEDFEHDNNEKLYLYYSKELFSNNWQPHIKNPIVTNASLARNAGNFYSKNGKLHRVSQNCMHGYGQNIVINEVKVLTENNYSEEKVNEIFPPKKYVGSHTLNTLEDIDILDFLIKE